MKKNWTGAFQIAAVYVGTVVGAGFATGREIVEFFTRFGFLGFIGILMSGYLFIYMGSKLMRVAARINVDSYQGFNEYLFGKWAGRGINILMLFMLFGVTSVMMAGAGAVFEEQLGLSRNSGIFLTIILVSGVMLLGTSGLFAVNILIVPLMISFCFILLLLSVGNPGFQEQFFHIPNSGDRWKAAVFPFLYTAFNLGLSQAVLVPVAAEIGDDWTIKWGGFLGGIALTIILIASHLTLVTLPNVEAYQIPMAVVMKNVATSGVHWLFISVIYGEIFTSVIGNVYGMERQLSKKIRIGTLGIVGGIFTVTYFISQINYGTLLAILYPLFGYVSMSFFILLWLKPLPRQK